MENSDNSETNQVDQADFETFNNPFFDEENKDNTLMTHFYFE